MKIGSAIKKLRINKNITQEQLAEYLNVSFQAVSKWETGVTVPDVALLPQMAIFFGVSIDTLFSVDDDEKLARIEKSLIDERMTEESFAYASKILTEMLDVDENNGRALNLLAEAYNIYAEMKMRIAAGYARRAISASPGDIAGYQALWVTIKATHGNPDEDMYAFCEGNAIAHPQLDWLHFKMAEICIRLRRFDDIEKFIVNLDEPMQTVFRGDIALAQGRKDEAYETWEKAATQGGLAGFCAGKRFERYGEIDRAIRVYENTFDIAKPPRYLDSVYARAFLFERLERLDDAIAMWEKIIEVSGSDFDILDGERIDWARREIEKLQSRKRL